MATIEERILRMRFDNAQFRRASQETRQDLANLKKDMKLDGVASGLDSIAKVSGKSFGSINKGASSVRLDPLVSELDKVTNKFSALEAISFGAFATIGGSLVTKAASAVRGMVSKVTEPIITGGMNRARNLEQANFMLSGLFDKLDENVKKSNIESVMTSANNAVTGTAYGLDEAAKAASQLAASQVPLDRMEGALKAIAGTASMTSSDFASIADIFTTVAGNGRMMGQELSMLSSRGLNAAASIGEHLGVTEAEVREMASKGKISFEIFSDAMENAFGAQAARANETYSGSLSNLRSALGRIGADVATVHLEKMRDLFNSLRPAVNAVHNVLKPFLGLLTDRYAKSIDAVIRPINTFTTALEAFNKGGLDIGSGWARFFNLLQDIGKIASLVGDVFMDMVAVIFGATPKFIEMSDTVTSTGTKIQHIFRKLLSVLMLGPEIIGHIIREVLGLGGATGSLGGSLLDIIDYVASFLYLTAEWIRKSTVLQTVIGLVAGVIRIIINVIGALAKGVVFVIGLFAKLRPVVEPVFNFILQIASKAKDAIQSVVETLGNLKTSALERVGKFLTGIFDGLPRNLRNFSFANMFKGLKNFKFPKIDLKNFQLLDGLLSKIGNGFKNIGSFFKNIDWSPLGQVFSGGVVPDLGAVSKFVKGIGSQIQGGVSNLNFGKVGDFASSVGTQFKNFGAFVRDIDYRGIYTSVKNGLTSAFQSAVAGAVRFSEWLGEAVSNIDWANLGNTLAEGVIKSVTFIGAAAGAVAKFVSDFFTTIFESIDWAGMLDGLKNFKDGIFDYFSDIGEIFKGEDIDTSGIENALGDATADVTVSVTKDLGVQSRGILDTIRDFISTIFGANGGILPTDVPLLDSIKSYFSTIGEFLAFIKKPLDSLTKGVTESAGNLGTTLTQVSTSLLEGVNIADIMNSIGIAFSGYGIFKMSETLAQFTKAITGVPEAISGAIKALGESFTAMGESFKSMGEAAKIEARGNAILKIAIAIAILAAAVWLLSKVPFEETAQGLIAVGLLLAGLVGALLLMNKFISEGDAEKVNAIGNALLKLAIAVAILAAAVWLLGKMDFLELAQGLGALMATILTLGASVAIAGFAKSAVGLGAAFMGIAAAVGLLALSFLAFKLVDWESIQKGLVTLGVLLLTFGAASFLSQGHKMAGVGVAFAGIGVGLLAIAYGFQKINELDEAALIKGFTTLVVIMGGLALLGKFGGTLKSSIGSLLGIAAVIMVLAYAVGMLGEFDVVAAGVGMLTIAAGLAMIGIAMQAFPKEMPALAGSILALAGAIAVMVAAIWVLGNMDTEVLAKGVISFAVAVGALSGALFAMSKVPMTSLLPLAASLIILVGAMIGIAYAVRQFEDISWDALRKGAAVLIVVGAAIALMGAFGAAASPGLLAMALGLVAIGGALLVIAAAAWVFADAVGKIVDALTKLGDSGDSIKDALESAGQGVTLFANEASEGLSKLFDLIGLTDVVKMGALAKLFASFALIPDDASARMRGLATGLRSLDEAFPVLEKLKDFGKNNTSSVLRSFFNTFSSIKPTSGEAISSLVSGIKELDTIHGPLKRLADFTKKGGAGYGSDAGFLDVFFQSFDNIDKNAGKNLSSLVEAIRSLDEVFETVEKLGRFSQGDGTGIPIDAEFIKRFFTAFDGIDKTAGENLDSVASALGKLGEVFETVEALGAFSQGDGTGIPIDAEFIKRYFTAFDGIDKDAGENLKSVALGLSYVGNAMRAIEQLAEFSRNDGSKPAINTGIISRFFKAFDHIDKDAGTKLQSVASALKQVGEVFETIEDLAEFSRNDGSKPVLNSGLISKFFEAFDNIDDNAGAKLSSVASALEQVGTVFETVEDLAEFSRSNVDDPMDTKFISRFFEVFDGIDENAGAKAQSVAKAISMLGASFMSIQNLAKFSAEGGAGADANISLLKNYFSMFDGIKEGAGEKAQSVATAIKQLGEAFTAVEELANFSKLGGAGYGSDAGFLDVFFKSFNGIKPDAGPALQSLATGLTALGGAMTTMEAMAEFSATDTDVSGILQALNSISHGLPANLGEDLSEVSAGMTELQDGVTSLRDSIGMLSEIDAGAIGEVMSAIDSAFGSGISESIAGSAEAIGDNISAMATTISAGSSEFSTAGTELMNGLIQGISDSRDSVNTAASDAVSTAAEGAREARGSFEAAGTYIGEGLAVGIAASTETVTTAARALGEAASAAARMTLGIHSPSRVFMEIGGYVSEGFAVGISSGKGDVLGALADTLDAAVKMTEGKTFQLKDSTKGFYDSLIKQMNNNPLTKRLEVLARHSKAAHATAVKERKIEDQEKLERAEEERKNIYKEVEEARAAVSEAKEDVADAKKDAAEAESDKKKSASDSTKAARDAAKQKEKITDAEERYQKAIRERDKYEYKMYGEEAGVAFVDGVAEGMMDQTEAIPTVAEILSELLVDEVDTMKEKVSNYGNIFSGFETALKTTKSMGDNVRDVTRAFNRLNNATSPRSISRNIEKILEGIIGFSGGIQELMGIIDVFEPFLPGLLGQFESSLPAISAMVAPFAPQLAASLGGGLAAAVPAILGPAGMIIGAVAGIGLFLTDQANGKVILKGLTGMFKGVIKFITSLPKKILGVIKTLIKGLKQTLKDLPSLVRDIVDGLTDLIVGLVDAIPEVIPELVEAIVEIVAWVVLNAPGLVLEIGAALIKGLIRAFDSGVKSLLNLLLSPFAWLTGKIGGTLDLKEVGTEAIRLLANGFASILGSMFALLLSPFRFLWNTIAGIFGFQQLGTDMVEEFKNAIVWAMSKVVDTIAWPFIGLYNLIAGIFGWEQLAYDAASQFIFGTSQGIDDNSEKVVSSADRVAKMLKDSLVTGAENTLAEVNDAIDQYMIQVSAGMVDGVKMGGDATRRAADAVWEDISSILQVHGLGQDFIDDLTGEFYEGTANPDTIVSSFNEVFDRIATIMATEGLGVDLTQDLNDSLVDAIRDGMFAEAYEKFGETGYTLTGHLSDAMIKQLGLSDSQIVAAADEVWANIEAVFDMYGLGTDQVDELRRAYEDGTKDPESFASSFDEVFAKIEAKLRLAGVGEETILALKNSMSTAITGQLNPQLKTDVGETRGVMDSLFTEEQGEAFGASMLKGLLNALTSPFRTMFDTGVSWVGQIASGITSRGTQLWDALSGIATDALDAIGLGWVTEAIQAGADFVGGLIKGIENNIKSFADEVRKLAKQALDVIGLGWLINSPSKATAELSGYFVAGLVQGIEDNEHTLIDSIENMSDEALAKTRSMLESLSSEMDSDNEIHITPVIDLDAAKQGVKELDGLLGGQQLSLDAAVSTVGEISDIRDGVEGAAGGGTTNITNIEFHQTNTSPEPLSAYEIYQNTDRSLKTLQLSGQNK